MMDYVMIVIFLGLAAHQVYSAWTRPRWWSVVLNAVFLFGLASLPTLGWNHGLPVAVWWVTAGLLGVAMFLAIARPGSATSATAAASAGAAGLSSDTPPPTVDKQHPKIADSRGSTVGG